MPKQFTVIRKAHLQEDEGHEHLMGTVEAETEAQAMAKALAEFSGNGYFKAFDFRLEPTHA
jgi:hypothetical protein